MFTLPSDPAVRVPVVLLSLVTALLVAVHYASNGRHPYVARMIGFALLGPPPVIAAWALGYAPSAVGVGPGELGPALAYGLLLGLALQPIIAMSARSLRSNPPGAPRPEVKLDIWTWRDVGLNAATWIVYLAAYEACFRGVLLQGLASTQGPWVATASMIAMYALYHLKQELSETIGTFPIGVVFALVALHTHSFVGPFVAHVLIGVGNDTWVLWFQGKFPPGRDAQGPQNS